MRIARLLAAILFLVVSVSALAAEPQPIGPLEATRQARNGPVDGVFEFTVRNTGLWGKNLYLDSEVDYRSPTSLNVEMPRGLWGDLKALVGGELESLVGHRIRVSGRAERVKIVVQEKMLADRRTVKRRFYYQTHVRVRELDQLTVID